MNASILTLNSISEVSREEWDSLNADENPFISHAFLLAAERHGATVADLGWYPRHIVIRGDDGQLLGALPLFVRMHSFGDFSQDWSWASAWGTAGVALLP